MPAEPRYEQVCAGIAFLLGANLSGVRPFGAAYEQTPRVSRQLLDPLLLTYFPTLLLLANNADEELLVTVGNAVGGVWRLHLSLLGFVRGDGDVLPMTWCFRLAEDCLRILQADCTLGGTVRDIEQTGRVAFHETPTDAGHIAGFERDLTVTIDEPIAVG